MSVHTIHIINGPNLNLLGKRETDIYGNERFESFFTQLKTEFVDLELTYFQSNHIGYIIDRLHENGFDEGSGIVLNGAGYTHTSIALGDAVAAIEIPVVEVHISNIYEREKFRHVSYVKPHAVHFISGEGLDGYRQAISFLRSWRQDA